MGHPLIGSHDDPVILVIDDQQLVDKGANGILYGVPYLFDNPSSNTFPGTDFGGSPSIYGSLVSDVNGGALQGSYSVIYDATLLGNLTIDNNSANYGIAYIPGSWRDFN